MASLRDMSASTVQDRLTTHELRRKDDIDKVCMFGLTCPYACRCYPEQQHLLCFYQLSHCCQHMWQVLEVGQVSQANLPQPTAHTMLSITLTGQTASGERLQTSLTFVELAAPEPRDLLGRPPPPSQGSDPGLTRSLSLAYASLTSVLKALTRPRAGSTTTSAPASHIPWRDSPLTRWLQHPLSNAAELLVVGTVAPGPEVGLHRQPSCLVHGMHKSFQCNAVSCSLSEVCFPVPAGSS
jgi:hypothetical protein